MPLAGDAFDGPMVLFPDVVEARYYGRTRKQPTRQRKKDLSPGRSGRLLHSGRTTLHTNITRVRQPGFLYKPIEIAADF